MRKILFLFFCFFNVLNTEATHIRCGQIRLERISDLTYKVSLLVYTNLGSQIKFGSGVLNFGDSSKTVVLSTIDYTPRGDLGAGVGAVSYSINHTFPAMGNYTISYTEPNLDAGIVNISNSIETKFYLETRIFLDSNSDCSSPGFITEPIFNHPVGKELSFSAGAIDGNDYSLRYDLVNPLAPGSTNFSMPENIKVNYYNGLVTWDAKYNGKSQAGEYLIAVRTTQYNSFGVRIGYTIKTYQIILGDGTNEIEIINPIQDTNNKIRIDENKEKTVKVVFKSNINASQFYWQAYYDQQLSNNISFTQYDSTSSVNTIKVGILKLNTSLNIAVRNNPYLITLRAKSISGTTVSKDINYLISTNDVDLPVVTGVSELEKISIRAFPNPFSDFIVLDTEPNSAIELTFLNIAGQPVLQSTSQGNEPIETSQLAPGVYILRLKTKFGTVNQRLMKR